MDSAQGSVSTELEQAREALEFGARTPLSEKLLAVAIRAQNYTGSSGIAIALAEGQEMICRASWGTSAPEVGARLSLEHSFSGLCVRAGEALRCDDAQSDPRVNPKACRALGINAIAAAPVRRGLKVIGVIAAFSDTPKAFSDKHLLILSTLSEVIVELLDDTHPTQALPELFETVPHLAHAAAVGEAPVTPVVDASGVTPEVPEPASGQAEVSPIGPLVPEVPEVPEVPVDGEGFVEVESPAVCEPPPSEPVSPVGATQLAGAAAPSWTSRREASRNSAANQSAEILPAAMDPGQPPEELQSSTHILSIKPAQTSSAVFSASDTPTFAAIGDSTPRRRWFVPAAVVAVVAVIGAAGWRWQVSRQARMAKEAPVLVQQPQAATPQPEAQQEARAPNAAPSEPQHMPSSPPAITTVKAVLPTVKPAAEPAADVVAHDNPQPVIEAAGPIRRPGATGISKTTQEPEAAAPQLAFSAPALPVVMGPKAAPVAAPVSRVSVAQLVHRVEPVYPETARRLKLSGKAVVKATITKAGTVGSVRWVSGNELFREATIAAVKQWRYTPASLNNQPVESDLDIVLQFNRPANQ